MNEAFCMLFLPRRKFTGNRLGRLATMCGAKAVGIWLVNTNLKKEAHTGRVFGEVWEEQCVPATAGIERRVFRFQAGGLESVRGPTPKRINFGICVYLLKERLGAFVGMVHLCCKNGWRSWRQKEHWAAASP